MRRRRHPVNAALVDRATVGQRTADAAANAMGSWLFIGLQSLVIVLWIAVNVTAVVSRWDPYPFILLNLLFSTQAAYAAPLILLSQNRQSEHDRRRADADFEVDQQCLASLARIEALLTDRS